MLRAILIIILTVFFVTCAVVDNSHDSKFTSLKGPYVGQTPPGAEPKLFAPGIISTGLYTRDVAITPDGKELYYCVAVGNFGYATILCTKMQDGRWIKPEVAPHMDDPDVLNFEPCIAPDGNKFYFLSNRPDYAGGDTVKGDQDIWVMDRIGDGWSEPYNLGPPVNTDDEEYYPSVTQTGTIYFTRNKKGSRHSFIYRSRLSNGIYQEPQKLGPEVNGGRTQYNAYVAADESFIIVPILGRDDSFGGTDYYIAFRKPDDTWIGPINLGDKINTERGTEYSPYVSPDGKYFFFMSVRMPERDPTEKQKLTYDWLMEIHNQPQNGGSDIYWVDASFISELRQEYVK